MTYDDRKNLPYVEAVITEIWRVVTIGNVAVVDVFVGLFIVGIACFV